MRRRDFIATATACVAAPAIARLQSTSANAEGAPVKWPDRPVKLVVPFAPGGSTDLVARPWAEKLTEAFGQQFIVENRGGASGMIGAEAVAKAPADGYTYLFATSTTLITLPLLRKTPYDPKSFVPVGRAGDAVTGFVVNPASGLKTFGEMIAYAKNNPGKLACGSSGAGTAPHLRLELLKLKAGIDILHVPYRGGAEMPNDVLSGAIQMMNEASSMPHVRAGKLTLLNVNHARRIAEFPDVPTLTELGFPNADGGSWFAFYGIKGAPDGIFERLNSKLVEIGRSQQMQARLALASAVLTPQTLPEIARYLEDDAKITTAVIRDANIRLE